LVGNRKKTGRETVFAGTAAVSTVSAGVGGKVINVSGYDTGAHIITLEGDGQNLDGKTLMVQ
jgi:hypothetical protein